MDRPRQDTETDSEKKATTFRWLVDLKDQLRPQAPDPKKVSTAECATSHEVKKVLEMLLPEEKARVLRYYHVRDAKLCLVSYLLKRRAIVKADGVPWSQALISEDDNRRPYYQPTSGSHIHFDFNVSHHGTLVALVGCTKPKVRVGIDVVQIPWDRDVPSVLREGFGKWINTYSDVFSLQELEDMVGHSEVETTETVPTAKVKLRNFYAHWCLKEAFIKMQEALLATWLKEFEFRNAIVPPPPDQAATSIDVQAWGGVSNSVDVWLRGRLVTDVSIEMQALGEDYLIATSVSERGAFMPGFELREIDDLVEHR